MENKFKQVAADPLFLLRYFFRKYKKRRRDKRLFATKYVFDDRRQNCENLLLIVAGFQEYYWETVFDKVSKNILQFEENIDVCVCVPKGCAGGGI